MFVRYANSLSGTKGFFQNEEAVLSCLSALRVASVCGATGDKDKDENEDEDEDDDMEGRGERVSAAVRVQARAQLDELLLFLSDTV